jgi:hypothetical protein
MPHPDSRMLSVRVRICWCRPLLRPTPCAAASTPHELHARSGTRATPSRCRVVASAGEPVQLRSGNSSAASAPCHLWPPLSLRSRARIRSVVPSAGKHHADAEPPHPWHRQHGYKRAPLPLGRTVPHQPSSSSKRRRLPCFPSPFMPSPSAASSSLHLASFESHG